MASPGLKPRHSSLKNYPEHSAAGPLKYCRKSEITPCLPKTQLGFGARFLNIGLGEKRIHLCHLNPQLTNSISTTSLWKFQRALVKASRAVSNRVLLRLAELFLQAAAGYKHSSSFQPRISVSYLNIGPNLFSVTVVCSSVVVPSLARGPTDWAQCAGEVSAAGHPPPCSEGKFKRNWKGLVPRRCFLQHSLSLTVWTPAVPTIGSEKITSLVTYSLLTGHTFFSHTCQMPTNYWHILACQTTQWLNLEFLMKGICQVWGNSTLLLSSQQSLCSNYDSNPLRCTAKDSSLLLNSVHSSQQLTATAKIWKTTLTSDYLYFIKESFISEGFP